MSAIKCRFSPIERYGAPPTVPEAMIRLTCLLLLSAPVMRADSVQTGAAAPLEYQRDIRPIFERHCLSCHGESKSKKGLRLDSIEAVIRGGGSGPPVVAGRSAASLLIERVTSANPQRIMPKKAPPLSAAEIDLLRTWIDQNPPELSAPKTEAAVQQYDLNLSPPQWAADGVGHSIDRILAPYFARHGIDPAPQVSDRTFVRRAYLDIVGMLPDPAELEAFNRDECPDRSVLLVRRLLADKRRYAEHWMTFWNDALRNDYQGTGYIDGGRAQITQWLFTALYENMPYDRFARELVNPTSAASAGFVRGITWRGVVNASQSRPMQAAQNVSQVFLGLNLKCASCHDSFINSWTLKQAYSLAAVFADAPLELVRCDVPLGVTAHPQFLYPELGDIDAEGDRAERLAQLAAILTDERNGRFSRTIVNRLWARLVGRGLIEPIDEMGQAAWNPALLDFLAQDLIENGYDLKRTIELILTSRAYQMHSVDPGDQTGAEYVFAGPWVRRMSAEQFVDAVRSLTGVWPSGPDASMVLPDESAELPAVAAQWIWDDPNAADSVDNGAVFFRAEFGLKRAPRSAAAVITCDNSYTLYVNGERVGGDANWNSVETYDLSAHLTAGRNVIAVEARNGPAASANPAGLFFSAQANFDPGEPAAKLVSGSDWRVSRSSSEGWTLQDFDASTWAPASEIGSFDAPTWRLGGRLLSAMRLAGRPVRAVYMNADPLMTVLGRPNREQVVTQRSSAATTMQAIELTNGAVLHDILTRGAAKIMRDDPDPAAMIQRLFQHALARDPVADEVDILRQALGAAPTQETVADLIWTLVMLPEFQFIR